MTFEFLTTRAKRVYWCVMKKNCCRADDSVAILGSGSPELAVWMRIRVEGNSAQEKDVQPRAKKIRLAWLALVVPKYRGSLQRSGPSIPSQAIHRPALARSIRPGPLVPGSCQWTEGPGGPIRLFRGPAQSSAPSAQPCGSGRGAGLGQAARSPAPLPQVGLVGIALTEETGPKCRFHP